MACFRKIPLVLIPLVLLLPGLVFALSINVSNEVPINTPWGFSVELPNSNSFDEAKIFLDSSEIARVYSGGQAVLDPANTGLVVGVHTYDKDPNSTSGLTVAIMHAYVSSGSHTIKVEAYDNGSISEEQSRDFGTFDLSLDDSDLELKVGEARADLDVMINKYDGFLVDFTEITKRVNAVNARLDEVNTQMDGQETKNSTFQQAASDLTSLQGTVNTMRAEVTSLQERLNAYDAEFAAKAAEEAEMRENSGLTGLMNLAQANTLPLAIGIIVIIVATVIFALHRSGRLSMPDFSGFGGERDPFDSSEPLVGENAGLHNAGSKSKGRWAAAESDDD